MRAVLDRATCVLGGLNPDARARLEAVLANPTQETWENAYSILVTPYRTLWQAWCAVDPDAPQRKPLDAPWPRVPDQFTLYRALRRAIGDTR